MFLLTLGLLLLASVAWTERAHGQDAASRLLEESGVRGGLVVHVGCTDGALTRALQRNDRFQVHGLARDADTLEQVRGRLMDGTGYGPRSADLWDGGRLPYIDNLVNLLVLDDDSVSQEEIDRVLVPGGVAMQRTGDGEWSRYTKPWPDTIDEWTHYLHDASGNAVAHDSEVGPPRHLQWVGNPRWSRHHDRMASLSGMVSASGRIFYIMDKGSRVSIQLPPQWTLVARDAFNGTPLWELPMEEWHSHLWPLKSGPTQLARRLVADGDRVYVTLGLLAPLTALDAATGELVHEYAGTASTEEVLLLDGTLVLLVNQGSSELTGFAPANNVGDQRRVSQETEFHWNGEPREIVALDAESGRELWRHRSTVAPLSLAAGSGHVYYHDGEKVQALSLADGSEAWHSPPAARRPNITLNFGPRVVVYGEAVLFAGGDRTMRAFDARTGKLLWSAPHAQSGYQSPEDLLVASGLVWSAPTTRTSDSGVYTGRNPMTGEVLVEFPPDVESYWFHHRCYIAKATDNFLLPSRTGIEFVDLQNHDWEIHHWVRGGCLYGIMPCNGLIYTPPHNCACYPETKLFGLSALAPARKAPEEIAGGRLERGPQFESTSPEDSPQPGDWPTYRGDMARSGRSTVPVAGPIEERWDVELGGRLSTVVVAGGRLYVAQIDQHTVHALDAETGEPCWQFTAGARVDSPPTVSGDYVYFGSADGWIYCVHAERGELVWRFRAAPRDERLCAFEQLESVWPVHGNVLLLDNSVYAVAGRSNFLDGGLRFVRLNAETGELEAEQVLDEVDPETGESLQERIATLQMPVGLPDILSSDGEFVYMRSQQFDRDGNRTETGPHSGQAAVQGATQTGPGAHLFSPTGFLDDTWFHRAYWVYGRSFAGGHNGYYQAGKYAPGGRLMVVDDERVYAFGRKPQYYRWTTTMEHELYAASKTPPGVEPVTGGRSSAAMVRVANRDSLDPTDQPLAVAAWIRPERPNGVVVARGGPSQGYALVVRQNRPRFVVRINGELHSAVAPEAIQGGQWVHLAGVLAQDGSLQLFVDGEPVATGTAPSLIPSEPLQAMEIGADDGGAVGDYRSPLGFTGLIDEVRLYHGSVTGAEIAELAAGEEIEPAQAQAVVVYSFSNGDALDQSGGEHHGEVAGARTGAGRLGNGLQFAAQQAQTRDSFVERQWTLDLPLLAQAMVLADDTIFVAGPPDVMNEEETFQAIMDRDPRVQSILDEQDQALRGAHGGRMVRVRARDGEVLDERMLDHVPVWDGLVAANGKLYMATADGHIVCLGAP